MDHKPLLRANEILKNTVMLSEPYRELHYSSLTGVETYRWRIAVSANDLGVLAAVVDGLAEDIYETQTVAANLPYHHAHVNVWLNFGSLEEVEIANTIHGYMALNILKLDPVRWEEYQKQVEQSRQPAES